MEKKKLKGWQIALLIIFYPAGIIYLIIKACEKISEKNPSQTQNSSPKIEASSSPAPDLSNSEIERDIRTKVVGVSFDNKDGSSRQQIIRGMHSGDDIILRPCPSKAYPDSIGVFTVSGKQAGFINAELAKDLKYKYPTNFMKCTVSDIHGGGDGKLLGLNLHLIIYEKKD